MNLSFRGPLGPSARFTKAGNGGPGEIRTPDLTVRSRSLYPTELRAPRIEFYYPTRQKRKRLVVRISQCAARSLGPCPVIYCRRFGQTPRNLQLSPHLSKLGRGNRGKPP